MTKEMGLWIDHRQAVIMSALENDEDIKRVTSGDATESHDPNADDGRDRHFAEQLHHYYEEVITHLRDASAILILGPGEAKGELQKHLETHGIDASLITVKTADKMTDNQLVAEIRQHFEK